MSAFWVTCPTCGARYFHVFVGTQVVSGHKCPGPQRPTPPNPYAQSRS